VGWRRWCATFVGFGGILLVVRPGALDFDLALIVAFLLALNAAAINLSTKDLTRTESTVTIMLWIGATTLVVLVPWSLLTWTWPTPWVVGLMFLIALVGMIGQYASITAYRYADASGLAPVFYTRIVLSGLIGWWVFGEVVDGLSLLGALLIAGSAVYITVRETRRRERALSHPIAS
jgi:drug/metabolite transporter (DMT)-like permease